MEGEAMAKGRLKKTAMAQAEADPRFIPVVQALAGTRGFSLMESKSQGTRGLMLNGKSFGMSSRGRFVLKLNEARALELIAEGKAAAFQAGPGRLLRGWIEVTAEGADWVALAQEALRLAQPKSHSKRRGR